MASSEIIAMHTVITTLANRVNYLETNLRRSMHDLEVYRDLLEQQISWRNAISAQLVQVRTILDNGLIEQLNGRSLISVSPSLDGHAPPSADGNASR